MFKHPRALSFRFSSSSGVRSHVLWLRFLTNKRLQLCSRMLFVIFCLHFCFSLQIVGHYKSFVRCVPKQNTPLADLGNAFLHLHSTRFFTTTTTQNNRGSRRGIGARHRRSPLVYEACPHPARGWGLTALPHRGIRLTTLYFGNTCAV